VNTTGSAATAASATNFTGSLAGDVTGIQSSTVVGRLQSRAVSSAAPANAQVLKWNGVTNQWEPAADNNSGGTVTSVATGAGLTGGPVTTAGTIALANSGVTAGTYTKLTVDSTGRATAGTQASAGDLSNGTSGSGAVVLATSPALAGTPTAPTAAAGTDTAQLATTAFVQSAASTAAAAVSFIKDSSAGNLPNKPTAWVGNLNSADAAAAAETNFEFLMGQTQTFTKFYCRQSQNNFGQTITFQVFDSTGSLVGGGNCVIAANSTSTTATVAITLTAGNLYAIKATSGSGNLSNADVVWWALGE
jgi:hypothetical protein